MKILGYVNRFNRGIARVQQELTENGNSKARFDVKNLTAFKVTVMNALASGDASEKNEEKDSEKTREKFREKTREKTREKIVNLILNDNFITTESMANEIGITIKGIEYHLAKLKQQGIIKRIGPDKGGHWNIVNNSDL